ncbi:hypothetical protein TNCV_2227621 [Trichonephila clavipes]|nr:hypothetical protein TNCV_2227621 [Trichonephila clavipes]
MADNNVDRSQVADASEAALRSSRLPTVLSSQRCCQSANKELKRFLKLIEDSDDNLAGFLSAEGIEWKFIYHLERHPLVVFGKLRLSQ